MAFDTLVQELRRAEQQLERQLEGIRTALSSLSVSSAVSHATARRTRSVSPMNGDGRRRRKMSAAARKAISDAQKKRWARHKAEARGN